MQSTCRISRLWRIIVPGLAVAAALTASISGEALADTPDGGAIVAVGGIVFRHYSTSWAGRSPQERADEVQDRINHTLSVGPVHAGDITVGQLEGDWVVLFRGRRLYTADPITAKLQKTDPKTLCNEWMLSLQKILPDLTRTTG